MKKKHRQDSSILICLCVLAFGIGVVLILMLIQEHPDDVHKNGALLDDSIVTRLSKAESGRMGSGGYYVHVRAMKDGIISKEDLSFNVGISLYKYFSVGDNVKIWEYKDVFYLDEYNNMGPKNVWPWQLVTVEIVCLALIIYLYRRRRGSLNQ